jgi:hypothetical protein
MTRNIRATKVSNSPFLTCGLNQHPAEECASTGWSGGSSIARPSVVARQPLSVAERRLNRNRRPSSITGHPNLHLASAHQVTPSEKRLFKVDL